MSPRSRRGGSDFDLTVQTLTRQSSGTSVRGPRRLLGSALVGLAAATVVAGGAHGRGGTGRVVRLTATPSLVPAFAPTVHDYVTRCAATGSIRITAWSAAGTTAVIDGRTRRTASLRLRPGASVTVEGRARGGTTTYHVRCLPADFPAWSVSGPGAPSRWYVTTPTLSLATARSHYVVIYDNHGIPIWWYRDNGSPIDAKLLPGRLVAYATFKASDPAYQVRRLDGTLVERVTSPDGSIDDHELQLTSNGDRVYLVYVPKPHVDVSGLGGPADATVLETRIEEATPAGKVVWSWSTEGHVSPAESIPWAKSIVSAPIADADGTTAYDVYHGNSVSVRGNTVLLSLRHTNAVYAIDRTTGRILWKLGGTPTPDSLTVVGDSSPSPFSGQHDARLLADGTITAFDDESFVGTPRAVHFRIDPAARTATLIGSVRDPTVSSSICCGSARLLDDGDWLVSWGGDDTFGEYGSDGTPRLRISFDGLFSYRAVPVAAGRLAASALRAGMDARVRPPSG